jgi:Carboxypeptidase regulatory-like domain
MNQLSMLSSRNLPAREGPKLGSRGIWRRGAGRWALGGLVATVALLAAAPVASAFTGSIGGTVTEKGSALPLQNVQVTVFNSSHQQVGFAETGPSGTYKVKELAGGFYKVLFSPPGGKLLPQYFNGKGTFSEADSVEVTEGVEKSGINAVLGEGTTISGRVTDTSGTPLLGVEVFASPVNGSESFFFGSAVTNSNGEYTILHVPSGSFRVGFFPEFGRNFIFQYWNNEPNFSLANPVEIKEEKPATAINAKLQEGGRISGTVTDAATHKPLSGVFVFGNTSTFEFFGFGVTNSNGEYTMVGLGTGTYALEAELFSETAEGGSEYINGTASGVGVTQGGNTTSGVNFSLVPKKPNNTSSPVASGTPSVGQTLSCSNGSWIGAPTLSYSYKWLRDGGAISGPTGNTYVVQSADEGHGVACEVTATNKPGHASATSNTLKVAVTPPPVPPRPTLTGARLTNPRFRVAKQATALTAKKAPLGTVFRFTLSAPSSLQIAITRSAPGLRRGHSCVAPTAKLKKKHAKRCNRTLKMGVLKRSVEPAGTDSVPFSGRLGKRPLGTGSYKATLVASGVGGSSIPVALGFVIVH